MNDDMPCNEGQRLDSEQTLHPVMTVGLVLVVFGINLLILGYALWISRPESLPEAELAQVVRLTSDGRAKVGGPAEDDLESTEWVPEPARVVNILDLPSPTELSHLFVQHCAACHGLDGRGRGPAAEQLFPRPRDFVESPFRFASPGGGRQQVIAALERTVSKGVTRSAMPGFDGVLEESQIAGLARYVFQLRAEASEIASEGLADVGVQPPRSPQLVARGRKLYVSMGCNICHGETGHGDGLNARSLVDSQGKPVVPADLASGLFKSGQTPVDLCRTILRGIPGTPMVSYDAVLTRDNPDGTQNVMDAWALVAYIQSLAPRPQLPGQSSGAQIVAQPAPDDRMVSDPAHVAWLGVEPTLVAVKPLWQREEETTFLWVRVARTAQELAICVDWHDETMDLGRDHGIYPDATAVMFALSDEVPALPMGVEIEGHEAKEPVNIWNWKADRQYDAITGQFHAAAGLARPAHRRWYLFTRGSQASVPDLSASASALDFDSAAADPLYQTAGAVGNVHSDPRLTDHSVLEANALGFGTLALQPREAQDVIGTAAWSDGLWRVVMVRPLVTDDENDVQFTSSSRIPIAFAVWNGSKGDHAGVKLVSGWHWLVIEP